mgnify:CR=1 FL=1
MIKLSRSIFHSRKQIIDYRLSYDRLQYSIISSCQSLNSKVQASYAKFTLSSLQSQEWNAKTCLHMQYMFSCFHFEQSSLVYTSVTNTLL